MTSSIMEHNPSRMIPRPHAGLLCIFLVLTAGCLDFEQVIEINLDGSGEVEYKYSVAEELLPLLAGSRKLLDKWQETGTAADTDVFSRAAVEKAFSGNGIRLEDFTAHTSHGTALIRFRLHVDNIVKTVNSERFGAYKIERDKNGNLQFRAEFIELGDGTGEDSEFNRELIEICKGMRLKLSVRGPGNILETSGSRPSIRRTEWLLEVDKDPQALLKPPRVQTTFASGRFAWE